MCLGANEEAAPKVITDATASVNQQVIAADVGNTTCWVSTNPVGVVEAYALDAGACHQLGTDLLAEPGREKSVQGTRTKGNVNLLSRSESCKQKNGAPACDQRELSQ